MFRSWPVIVAVVFLILVAFLAFTGHLHFGLTFGVG